MKHFISRKTYYLKIAEISIIMGVIFSGLFLYEYYNLSFFHEKNNFNFTSNLKYDLRFSKKIKDKSFPTEKNQQNAKSIPVLLYHGVMDKIDGSDTTNISYDNFADQMIMLNKNGWQTITLKDFYDSMVSGKSVPEKSFLLTFDDGRKDSYYPVDPVLEELNYNAVIFVITENLEKGKESNFYLNKKELKKMRESGRWEIQPHTFAGHGFIDIDESGNQGHFYSNKKWLKELGRLETDDEFNERVKNDLLLAKEKISGEFNADIIGFAFPFGDFGQESINFPQAKDFILKNVKEIYPLSFYQFRADGFSFNYQDKDLFMAKRISVKPEWGSDFLLGILEKGRAKEVPFQDNFETDKGWLKTWGENEFVDQDLIIKSNNETTGSSVFLDGTRLWRDYAFEAKVGWNKGSNVLLLARYQDDSNYVACNFGQNIVRIESRINGDNVILKEEKMIEGFPKNNLALGIRVSERKIQCFLDNKIIVEAEKADSYLEAGGIGFKTWDREVGNSELLIHEVAVSESSWENKERYVQSEMTEKSEDKKPAEKIAVEKKSLPFSAASITPEQGWKKSWGEINFSNNEMSVKSSTNGTGGLVFLEGAEDWTNYSFTSKINWVKGSNFVVLSRFKDGKNYLAFNVGKEFIRLEKYVNGKSKIIKETVNDLKLDKDNINVKINVTGNRITYFIDDKLILEDSNDIGENNSGSVGFKVWDKKFNNSEIIIKQVEISER